MSSTTHGITQLSGQHGNSSALKHEDFECVLCLRLLYEPSTLRCGHSFCRTCCQDLFQQNHAKCPTCRTLLPLVHGGKQISTSFTLCKILETAFPDEYQRRRNESLESLNSEQWKDQFNANELPIFYLDPMLPRQQMQLNIYEPRYILMISRCLEGSRRFGMVGGARYGIVGETRHGVEVEIVDSEPQRPSGRIHIRVQARRLFVMEGETRSLDGYTVANIEWLDFPETVVSEPSDVDSSEVQGESESNQLSDANIVQLATELEPLVDQWKSLVVSGRWQRYGGQMATLLRELGPMPEAEDCASSVDRAFWIGALINPLPGLGVAPEIRPALLANCLSPESCLEIVKKGLQRSIDHMTPDPLAAWLEYHLRKLRGGRIPEQLGEAPPSPGFFLFFKLFLKLCLILTAVSFMLSRSGGDDEEEGEL